MNSSTQRDRIREIVNEYAILSGNERRHVYKILYSAVEDNIYRQSRGERYLDLKARAQAEGVKQLEIVARLGLLPMALEIAESIFREVCHHEKNEFFAATGS